MDDKRLLVVILRSSMDHDERLPDPGEILIPFNHSKQYLPPPPPPPQTHARDHDEKVGYN